MSNQDIEKLEKRLENTERVLLGLVQMIEDTQPNYIQESMTVMMDQYFDANISLGSEVNKCVEFKRSG